MSLEPGTRRGFILGAAALLTAPMIVRAEALMPVKFVDLYDTRCLVSYCIGTDSLILRVDRSLIKLPRPVSRGPQFGGWEISVDLAKKLMPIPGAFTTQPPAGVQRHTDMQITNQELIKHGFVWV